MKKIIAVTLGVLSMAVTASAPDPASLAKGNTTFAIDLYKRLGAKPGNLFFSPYSISAALAVTHLGARGKTATEIASTLHFPFAEPRLGRAYAELARPLRGNDAFTLRIANALWVGKKAQLRKEFVDAAAHDYAARAEQLDFDAPEPARRRINSWVSEQTSGMIPELLPSGTLDSLTRLVITNAVYMKAKWMAQFDVHATSPQPFHVNAKQDVQAPLMRLKEPLPYAHTGGVRVLEMPYVGGALSMVVVLPDDVEGLAKVEQSLTEKQLASWIAALKTQEVIVRFPKFKSGSTLPLNEPLKSLGMHIAFVPGQADFSGMTTAEKLNIAVVLHEARVDVTEEGTEAAAATAVAIRATSMRIAPPPEQFNADHPFLYLIRDRKSGTVLFMGRMVKPGE